MAGFVLRKSLSLAEYRVVRAEEKSGSRAAALQIATSEYCAGLSKASGSNAALALERPQPGGPKPTRFPPLAGGLARPSVTLPARRRRRSSPGCRFSKAQEGQSPGRRKAARSRW